MKAGIWLLLTTNYSLYKRFEGKIELLRDNYEFDSRREYQKNQKIKDTLKELKGYKG